LSDGIAVHADGHGHDPDLQHQFSTLRQQHEAATLGMWIFLVTEVMFFGGLFTCYMLYRMWYPEGWAEASSALNIVQGGVNTAVLIASSLTMALAVRGAQTGARKATMNWLILTMGLGLTFLVIKGFEYHEKWVLGEVPGLNFTLSGPFANQEEIFFSLYFAMTGLHALHMVVGFGILSVILWMTARNRFSPRWYTPVEMSGLYWHFVDIVWIFLFPLLYLVDRVGGHA
jgi:cytochrome c oxidase subunit 3